MSEDLQGASPIGEVGDGSVAERLSSGKAFADLSSWRKIGVSGSDALGWLNDLVSADISRVAPNRAAPTLLLSPTGHVRATFTVAVPGGTMMLLQDPGEPNPIDRLLAPYVLSSDVDLDDRTGDLALFAIPNRPAPPNAPGSAFSAPSVLGTGVDLISLRQDHDRLWTSLTKAFAPASPEDVEAWRVMAGIPRFGVDGDVNDLPQEAGLADLVSFGKGCYLGQEAMAKVRNLGHPRRVLLALEASRADVSAGEAVLVDGAEAGRVTSAAQLGGRTVVMAKVRWDRRDGPFLAASGTEMVPRPDGS